MVLSANRFAILIGSSALTMGLLTPFAAAQIGRNMRSGSMGMPSMGRNTFTGGVGRYPNISTTPGLGRASGSSYGARATGQGGNSGGSSSYRGSSPQPPRTSASSQPYGPDVSYAPQSSSPSAGSSQQAAGTDPFTSLRLSAGGLNWPVALRYLTRDGEARELRERIDAQVERLATRRLSQSAPAVILQELREDVETLRKDFERQGFDMPTTRQQDADARRFLSKVRAALEPSSGPSTLSASPK